MSVRATGAAVLAYLLLTLGLTYPFSTHLTTHVLSHGTDMDLAVWSVGWNVHAFTHAPWRIFDANIFFPFHNALAYSENLIGASFVAAPVIWLTGNTILGMNIAALFSVFAGACISISTPVVAAICGRRPRSSRSKRSRAAMARPC